MEVGKLNLSEMEQEGARVLEQLEQHGFLAFFVGGYVRDKLMDAPISDIDIATSASPEQVMTVFPRHAATGLQHGTVTVIQPLYTFEVTTFRTESDYADYRRPQKVAFVQSLEEDLKRRDFTINAMAFDRFFQLYDPFDGCRDMTNKLIRAVGKARERFEEDALRIIRCLRFAVKYQFAIDAETFAAIHDRKKLLKHIAMERVYAEWEKMMASDYPAQGIRLLVESGVLEHVKEPLPASRAAWESCLHEPFLQSLQQLGDSSLRWIRLIDMLGLSEKETANWADSLRMSNERKTMLVQAVRGLRILQTWEAQWETQGETEFTEWQEEWRAARQRTHLGEEASYQGDSDKRFENQFKLWVLKTGKETVLRILDISRVRASSEDQTASAEPSSFWSWIECHGRKWLSEMPVHALKDLSVTGKDLMAQGMKPGPQLGEMLGKLLEEAALGHLPNRREALLKRAIDGSPE
ncbi:CCA tRNA nucleotidyltransferase [Marinicrinis sediminis]|uniref:CCA tRNA nucleotidyltransferase n=1 Tax=Marinicrinis sediminis TaxID=1652465 RepID=A0ABW5REV6_9BACL